MGVISGGNVINLAAGAIGVNAGVPTDGADEVQTLVFAGIDSGTFPLTFDGHTTGAITWSSTNATLVSNIDAALEALPNIGSGGVTVGSTGTLTNGLGTVTVTFDGANVCKMNVPTLSAVTTSLVGTTPTITIATSTVGTLATFRGAATAAICMNSSTGELYTQMHATPPNTTWTNQT